LILERCTAVWLDADLPLLAERVSRRDSRPLLKNKDPLTVLADLASARNPIYAHAHIHVRSEPTPHDTTVERIIEALAERDIPDAAELD
jgi:shikimate kinase